MSAHKDLSTCDLSASLGMKHFSDLGCYAGLELSQSQGLDVFSSEKENRGSILNSQT